ncbi:acyl-CoA ligase (AMP-forming), exosortase A system-associated [Qipengyuania gelatinilytica]|uniref:Acyl-CoA ligase (AMP-forming), exosortase A system-associated n=1 Tax=Qipengyuania gelatinilytica TaxID=2867231 RepID=A0ABX9A2G5_9SPHN|nr:acyl-CoA ligase (AMP-forming), exosortase A system-associated [Qipengyuania gelatinilytica]QZD95319.1 acyl-CoA ligase (AMP-forming), exosortase A system-associated [Qipengyuania gelatinilytica]
MTSARSVPDPDPRPLDWLIEGGEADAPALILRDKILTFQEARDRVGALAGWLCQNLSKGDRVASWVAKTELACFMPLAAARAGVVHVPINPLLKRAQVAHILADCGARMLIATMARMASLEDGDTPEDCVLLTEEEAWSSVEEVKENLGPSSHDPEDLVAILYTSGSTGSPKGVMLNHANLWLGAASVAHYLGLGADDVTLAVLPLSFDYGQNQLLSTWYAGGSVVPLDYLFAKDVAKACAKHSVTTLAAVPPLWVQLLEVDWPAEAVASMRRLTNSGGALTIEIVSGLQDKLPQSDIFPMYGLTEAFRSTYLDPALVDEFPTSMGRAIPFAEILVIDDNGEVCGPEQEGELVHCGPLVAQGYWNDPRRTAERFKPAPAASHYGGTAVWSGDRVMRAENGLLYFVGRRDAMIKSSGNRISPQEIESAALATGLVAEAVALGVPDERLGHAIHLVVRAASGTEEVGKDLQKALARDLPNFMQPHVIHWRDAMPLNPNGKIDRTALAKEIAA